MHANFVRESVGELPPIISVERCMAEGIRPADLDAIANWHDRVAKNESGADKKRHEYISAAVFERSSELWHATNG